MPLLRKLPHWRIHYDLLLKFPFQRIRLIVTKHFSRISSDIWTILICRSRFEFIMSDEMRAECLAKAGHILWKRSCCKKMCLIRQCGSIEAAALLVQECLESVHNMPPTAKSDFLRLKLNGCINGTILQVVIFVVVYRWLYFVYKLFTSCIYVFP